MKTYINRDTLEFFALVAQATPQGFICMGREAQLQILVSLGLTTPLDRLGATRLTDKGEAVASQFLEILREI